MSLLFSPFTFNPPRGPLTIPNRIVVAPMCQYACHEDGRANDWHLMHWANLLNGGAGLFMIEATAVSPQARITPNCLGLWDEQTAAALSDTLGRARRLAPPVPVCLQIAHSGRKGSSAQPWHGGMMIDKAHGGWDTQAPSPLALLPGEAPPHEIDAAGLQALQQAFVETAKRAQHMGLEMIELHGAHGYLLHEFLSPIANQRSDNFGGSFENRVRFPLQIFKAMREVFDGTFGMRLSVPIFSSWNRMYKLKQYQLEKKKTEIQRGDLGQALQLEYQSSSNAYKEAVLRYTTQQKNLNLAREVRRVNTIKFKEGLINSLTLTQIERQFYEAQQGYFQALFDVLSRKADVLKSMEKF